MIRGESFGLHQYTVSRATMSVSSSDRLWRCFDFFPLFLISSLLKTVAGHVLLIILCFRADLWYFEMKRVNTLMLEKLQDN